MNGVARLLALICIAWSMAPGSGRTEAPYDLILAGGRVFDGTGNPWFTADVGIRGGRIAAIGGLDGAQPKQRIDVSGQAIAPGFIDIHSHADDMVGNRVGLRSADARRRQAANFITQGITTVVVNPDGFGEVGLAMDEQRSQLETRGIAPNAVLMVPHNAVRAQVMGGDYQRPARDAEIAEMRRLTRRAMQQGAFGLSSGLEYSPGRWSTTDELTALMEEVAAYRGVHISHIRSESKAPMWWLPSQKIASPATLMESMAEIITVAERTRSVGVISHIKARGASAWGQSAAIIDMIEAARARGVQVYADQYPYDTSGSDGRVVLVPQWAFGMANDGASVDSAIGTIVARPEAGAAPSSAEMRTRLKAVLADAEARAALYYDINFTIEFRGGAEKITVLDHPDRSIIGQSLAEIAKARRTSAADVAISFQLDGFADLPGGARLRSFSLDDTDIIDLMRRSWVATASDGDVRLPEDGPAVHARSYGTFPRKLSYYVRERRAISLEHAVRSSTSLPAQIMGLKDRGVLREGAAADIVVFDPERIQDTSTVTDPHRYAAGIGFVWINGVAVVASGAPTGALPGQVLRPDR